MTSLHLDIMMFSSYIRLVRTTLHIDDDLYEAARSLAAIERTSVGKVISRLARRALKPGHSQSDPSGFPVFAVPDGTAPLTPDMVRDALDEA
jgi:hypothetical protein